MTDKELDHFRKAIRGLREGGSSEYELNLACWLGERAHYLIAEIDRLCALHAKLVEACEAGLCYHEAIEKMPSLWTAEEIDWDRNGQLYQDWHAKTEVALAESSGEPRKGGVA